MTPLVAVLLLRAAATPPPHIQAAAVAYRSGKAELAKNRPTDAVELFEKAIQIEPTFLDAYKELIAARVALRDGLATAAVITRLLEIEPDLILYRVQLGQILLDEKQWDRALAQFSIALREDPLNADALFGFANAAQQLGMQDRAEEALSKGRSQHPKDKRFSSPL